MITLVDYDRLDENNVRGLFGCDSEVEIAELPVDEDLNAFGLPNVQAVEWSLCIVGATKKFYYKTNTGWERLGK